MLVPPGLSWPLVTPVPHRRLEEEGKIPSVFLVFPAEKAQAPLHRPLLLSFTILQLPVPQFCSVHGSALLTVITLHSPCPASQTVWAFWECNAGHFCLNSPAWGCWSWQGISRNGEVFQSLLSLLEHKGLSDMQSLISDTDSEGRLKGVGVLAWLSCKRWNVRFKSPVLDEFRSSGMKGMKDSMKQVFSSHFSALISHTLKQVSSGSQLSPLQKACSSWWPLLPQDRES